MPTLLLLALWMHSSDSALHNVFPRLCCMLVRMYGIILWQAWETSGSMVLRKCWCTHWRHYICTAERHYRLHITARLDGQQPSSETE